MTDRIEVAALYGKAPSSWGKSYTDWLSSKGRENGVNRQCSIGWHEECSDPDGERCRCLCHDGATMWTVEGHPEGADHVITRAEPGEHRWPPVEGEPEGTWAYWVLALDEEDAGRRAKVRWATEKPPAMNITGGSTRPDEGDDPFDD
jgi:hypothetical protein